MQWLKNLILTKEEKYWINHGKEARKHSFIVGMKVGEKHTFNMADHYRFGGLSLSPDQICKANPVTYNCGKIKALNEIESEMFPALRLGVDVR